MRISFESFSLVDILCEIGVLSIGFRSQEDCGPFGDLHLLRKAPRYYMALKILAQTYHGNGQCQSMPGNEEREFKDAVEKAFEKILAFPVGIELRKEINSAACDLSVLKPGKGQANKCTLVRQDKVDRDGACYREVLGGGLLRAKIQQLLQQRVLTPGHPAVKKFIKFYVYVENLQYLEMMPAALGEDDGEFYSIAHKGGKAAHTTEAILRGRVTED